MLTRTSKISLANSCAALLAIAFTTSVTAAPARRVAPAHARNAPIWSAPTPPRNIQFQALPLERSRQNHLLVRAFINGKPALLGVDSGAPVSAIATNRVAYFGLDRVGENAEIPRRLRINGKFNPVVVADTLQLGALNLVDEPLVAVDLGNSSRAARMMNEQAIDGILGADILFPTKAVLDCGAQVLTLRIDPSARGATPGVDFRGLSRVPMHVSSGFNLYVDGKVNGKNAKLMVDTGAFTTLLHQRFVRRMKIPMRDSPFSSAGVNLATRDVHLATISRLSVGSVEMRGKEVAVMNMEGLIRDGLLDATPPVAGLLGSEMLQRHNGILDFGTKTLYLRN